MDIDTNWLNKLSVFIDENKRQIQYGFYSVAAAGVLIAVRSVHPMKKFSNASSIPSSFAKKHVKLNGTVQNVEVSPLLLLRIDHRPIFFSKLRRRSSPGLGVEISSLNVTSNGISWLQHMLTGKNVKFVLLKKYSDYVSCIVVKDKENVSEELLKLGFATVKPIDLQLQNDKLYLKYYKKLIKLEDAAERRGVGVWIEVKQGFVHTLKNKILNTYDNLIKKLFK